MKPCIILWSRLYERFEAYSESGRLIGWVHSPHYETAVDVAHRNGYEPIYHNSRIGRTILDKVEGHVV